MRAIRFSKLVFLVCSLWLGSGYASAGVTELRLGQYELVEENHQYHWVNFEGKGSDGNPYEGSITCYPADRTYNGIAHGSMHVLREKYHAGVHTNFSYEVCLEMLENLSQGLEEVILTWKQEELEALKTGKLNFVRVLDPDF